MPRKRTLLDAVKVTMNFHRSDYARMKELYPTVGPQAAIRALVKQHVQRSDERLRKEVEDLISEIDLEGLE